MHGRTTPPPLWRHIGEYLSIKMLLYIAMTHAWAYPPPLWRHIEGVPVNHNVTKNSDDIYSRACLGRTPLKHVRARTPHLSIKLCLDMTSFGNVLLLFIAMTHAGCGFKLCRVTKNRDDKLCSPLSETQVDGEVKLKMYEKCKGKICNLNFSRWTQYWI